MSDMPSSHTWAFKSRFRREAYGWKATRLASERITEALAEIRRVFRTDGVLAAEGAVAFLERLSPALCQVDGSSGALGNATWAAVEELVPILVTATATDKQRRLWLERLFDALMADDPPYLESLGMHWGELCGSKELAAEWANRLLPSLRAAQQTRHSGRFTYFTGTDACFSALFSAGEHDTLLDLVRQDRSPTWHTLRWAGRVLLARGQVDEAIAMVHDKQGLNTHQAALARFCEDALLQAGRRQEAFEQYALKAHETQTNLGTYRAIKKQYPEVDGPDLLDRLVRRHPGQEGKWFATAKTLKLWDQAVTLAWSSPCDPKTLTRSARDHQLSHPGFALECALASLHWISMGYGYELTGLDVLEPWNLSQGIVEASGQENWKTRRTEVVDRIQQSPQTRPWLRELLGW